MDKKLDAHLFICTNKRDNGECCASKDSAELRDAVKKQAKARGWKGRVRINAAGCLDRCSEGIAAVLYPSGEWFTGLTTESGDKLLEAIERTLKTK